MLRRTMLWLAGLTMARPALATPDEDGREDEADDVAIEPRHVLCFLGKQGQLDALKGAAVAGIAEMAPGFSVDDLYSQDEADDRMPQSFGVCWDRVHPAGWTEADEAAVEQHGCVLYLLGPSMKPADSIDVSAMALRLTVHMLDHGAVAAKGESAGVAHGLVRWRELGAELAAAGDRIARGNVCRLAFAKRPLGGDEFLTSVGFHLIGLPEVYVSEDLGNELDLSHAMDRVANEMLRTDVATVLERYRAELYEVDSYDEEDFKFNPYGAVHLTRL